MNVRKVTKILQSSVESENATVKSWIINGTELGSLDPFVKFEEFTLRKPGVIPEHPHRGVDTVTYVWEGVTDDEDCFGNIGRLEPGDVQWVTAGRGVVHARVPISEEPVVGLQFWLNLPRRHKMSAPTSQELRALQIPRSEWDGMSLAVICGETLGLKSIISTKTPMLYLDISLQPETLHVQPVPAGWTTVIYVLTGTLQVTSAQQVEPHHAVLFSDGDCVKVETQGPEVCRFLLLSGERSGEPIIHSGQFVMSTEEEITLAIEDHQNCINGFEKALNWKSEMCELARKH